MPRVLPARICLLTLFVCASIQAPAQVRPDSLTGAPAARASRAAHVGEHELKKGDSEYGVWGGGSFDSPTLIGTSEGRRFLIAGLHYGRVFATSGSVAYEYTVDAVPLAVVFQPDEARLLSRNDSAAVYGFGVMPVGFKFIFNRRGKVKPFAGTSGGLLYFREPVPIDLPGATRLNFAFDFSAGLQIPTGARRALSVGYKFHHVSNGSRTDVNPGLDGNVFYVGYSVFR